MAARPAGLASLVLGEMLVSLLPDGYHRADPIRTFAASTPEDWARHRHLLDEQGRLVMTLGSLLVQARGQYILIDLGFGPRSLAWPGVDFLGGRMLKSLGTMGLRPGDIDVVIYTHLHLDHVGWTTTAKGGLTFDRARHLVAEREWSHWTDPTRTGGPRNADLAALANRVELVDGEVTPIPGITIVPTPGHTPGHCSVLLSSGPMRAIVLGDAVHCPLQLSHPDWAFEYDANPEAARRSRQRLLRELDDPASFVVGPHFPDAVFGRVLPGTRPRRWLFDLGTDAKFQPHSPSVPPQVSQRSRSERPGRGVEAS